jgi:hypothetical protein
MITHLQGVWQGGLHEKRRTKLEKRNWKLETGNWVKGFESRREKAAASRRTPKASPLRRRRFGVRELAPALPGRHEDLKLACP